MARLRRDVMRRRLERDLARSFDEPMIGLVAATAALISGNPAPLAVVPDFPAEALGAEIGSAYYLAPWTLETLVNELLATPKDKHLETGGTRVFRHDRFKALRLLCRSVAALENAEDGIFLNDHDVFTEMGRIAQRQFPWQRGVANAPSLYRALLLYGSGSAAQYFEQASGISVSDFVKVGAWLSAALDRSDHVERDTDLLSLNLSPDVRDKALGKLAIRHLDARRYAKAKRDRRLHTAYRPSILRDFPIIAFGKDGERLRAPLPELIMNRYTSGLYLDVVGGGSAVWTGIGERFERYCVDYLTETLRPYEVLGERAYGPKKTRHRTPDVLVAKAGRIVLVAECKAKRMPFEARFADEPFEAATSGFDEVGKGIFQIWRYFSHCRRGLASGEDLASDCACAVITADTWLTMARNEHERTLGRAHALADAEGDIQPGDRRAVAICPIDDVEFVLQNGDADALFSAMRRVAGGEQAGWMLAAAHQPKLAQPRPYPFTDRIAEILPWWE